MHKLEKGYTTGLFLIMMSLVIAAGVGTAFLITNALQSHDYNINLEKYPVLQFSFGGLFPKQNIPSKLVISSPFATPAITQPPSPTPLATPTINPDIANKHLVNVSGYAFNDVSGNGVYNTGEPRLVNVGFYVYDSANPSQVITTIYTDQYGSFRNSFYVVGDAIVRPVASDKYEALTTSETYTTIEQEFGFAFKLVETQPVGNIGNIQGHIYSDLNKDRRRESNEPYVYFKQIYITDGNGKTYSTTSGKNETDQNGSFEFANLPISGTYSIRLIDETGNYTLPKFIYTYYLTPDQTIEQNIELPVNQK